MRIAIAGAGRIGATLGKIWAGRGHEVVFTLSRDPTKLAQVAREAGGEAAEPPEAVRSAEVVLLAVPGGAVADALGALGSLGGKVVIDATNYGGDGESSGAENVAARSPGARVVKAINTVFAPIFPEAAAHPGRATMLIAGDDGDAKEIVASLVRDLGFEPLDAGDLSAAGDLEAFARLAIALAYRRGYGPFAYRFAKPAEL